MEDKHGTLDQNNPIMLEAIGKGTNNNSGRTVCSSYSDSIMNGQLNGCKAVIVSKYPQTIRCLNCRNEVQTDVQYEIGATSLFSSMLCVLSG
ncbi:hypothetical protein GJ496_008294 [Pomphorhynchus laevis]|nr:hypothetical protein GJ496_008294 [Pomphorhynchus laevis]